MNPDDSITEWIDRLRAGDARAAAPLWERYFARLVGMARRRLGGVPRAVADEEDVAVDAFEQFCRSLREGRFPDLFGRDDLWRLLLTLTERKAIDLIRHQNAARHGGGARVEAGDGLGGLPGREPTPEFAAQVADELDHLLRLLGDDGLRTVAVRKLEGFATEEIARELDCSPRTVERKLGIIRGWWEKEVRP